MILEARQIKKDFLRQRKDSNILTAVQETDLTLEEGKITILSGRSGSGKTTLLNMLSGLLTPTSGQVLLGGQDLYGLEDKELSRLRNQHFGVIPQGQTAISSMNILENVLLPYRLWADRKTDPEQEREVQDYARKLLEETGIASLAEVMPSELSGGELRRMAVARALVLRPEIIFADEPTGDLDEENTAIVLGLLRKAAEEGCAVLLVTHDPEALPWGDLLYEMKAGHIEVKNVTKP